MIKTEALLKLSVKFLRYHVIVKAIQYTRVSSSVAIRDAKTIASLTKCNSKTIT